jgi:hypothetical protein
MSTSQFLNFFRSILIISIITLFAACGGGGGSDDNGNNPSMPTVSVTGRVLDSNGTPVPSADVTIASDPVVVKTDENGQFTADVPPGDHEIIISMNDVGFYENNFTAREGSPIAFGDLTPTVSYIYTSSGVFTVPIANISLDGNESDWQNIVFFKDENTDDDRIDQEYIIGQPDIDFIKIATDTQKNKLFFLVKFKDARDSLFPDLEIWMGDNNSSNDIKMSVPYILHFIDGEMVGGYEVSVINESTGTTVEQINGYNSLYYIEFGIDMSNIDLNGEYTISGKAEIIYQNTYVDNFNIDGIITF